jgi:hypothetical protein
MANYARGVPHRQLLEPTFRLAIEELSGIPLRRSLSLGIAMAVTDEFLVV